MRHRPDLKQFILDLIISSDGDIPLFLRVGDGNKQDKAMFGKIATEYKSIIDLETMIIGDSALYTGKNLKLMEGMEWLSRVPLSIKEAKNFVSELQSFVLQKVYQVERDKIREVLEKLIEEELFFLEKPELLIKALDCHSETSVSPTGIYHGQSETRTRMT